MKHYYKCGYGGNASILERADGSATLRCYSGGQTAKAECKSLTSAKRLLSRWTDGLYTEIQLS